MKFFTKHRAVPAAGSHELTASKSNRTYSLKRLLTAGVIASLVVFSIVLVGCNAGNASSENASTESDGDSVEVIKVGTAGHPSPYGWTEEDGSLGGYDQAVLREIGALLPQYSFEPEVIDFPAIFTGLDSNRYQLAANNFSYTEERAKKYYFSQENYIHNTIAIAYQKDRTDIADTSSLGGKSAVTSNDGVAFQLYLEAYNESNPNNPINITYSDQDMLATLTQVQNGTIDFNVCELAILNYYQEEFGIELDYFVLDIDDTYGLLDVESYYLFPKTEQGNQLSKDIDTALKTLKENGTLSRLSEEYFGFDMFSSEFNK